MKQVAVNMEQALTGTPQRFTGQEPRDVSSARKNVPPRCGAFYVYVPQEKGDSRNPWSAASFVKTWQFYVLTRVLQGINKIRA